MTEKLYSYYGQPFDEAKAKAEIDRLRAELEKAMRIVGASLHSDAATERIKLENERLRTELAELNSPSALGNLLQECRRLRSALDAIRRHSGKDTDAHQLALEALEAAP